MSKRKCWFSWMLRFRIPKRRCPSWETTLPRTVRPDKWMLLPIVCALSFSPRRPQMLFTLLNHTSRFAEWSCWKGDGCSWSSRSMSSWVRRASSSKSASESKSRTGSGARAHGDVALCLHHRFKLNSASDIYQTRHKPSTCPWVRAYNEFITWGKWQWETDK